MWEKKVSNAVGLQKKTGASVSVDAGCTHSFDKSLHEKVPDIFGRFQAKVNNR